MGRSHIAWGVSPRKNVDFFVKPRRAGGAIEVLRVSNLCDIITADRPPRWG